MFMEMMMKQLASPTTQKMIGGKMNEMFSFLSEQFSCKTTDVSLELKLVSVPELDKNGKPIMIEGPIVVKDDNGNPIIVEAKDKEGKVIMEDKMVQELDENGRPMFIEVKDENGNVIMEEKKIYLYDESGAPIMVEAKNENGETIMIDMPRYVIDGYESEKLTASDINDTVKKPKLVQDSKTVLVPKIDKKMVSKSVPKKVYKRVKGQIQKMQEKGIINIRVKDNIVQELPMEQFLTLATGAANATK